jgi:hypothetical protein
MVLEVLFLHTFLAGERVIYTSLAITIAAFSLFIPIVMRP